ncbi:ABC transporter substrate-binding protein [Psychromonas sp. MB-3u-54]|uniref:MlaC/ttg2D family ABC transporter substrate-binding protein n=1 Tax=Psychromonas sp. MB-3u-54 TaxID=2058319 RepID=UPI000C348924|nr:ABC transporter substrate-binding protein [Psychromonas sp. MB-3u-54]PKH01898.1 ABC transporter substrate-binding protein [Psychromonas sp. MB-3u-54]
MRHLLIVMTLLFSSIAFSDQIDMSNPNKVIQSVSTNTFARITAEEARLKADPDYIQVVIEEELIPYFDYKYAAYKVLGAHLRNTTIEQRNEFVEAFRLYLINSYGNILFKYDQQEIQISANTNFKNGSIVTIPVRVRDKDGQIVQLSFKLRENKKSGEWKVFDVIAEGISMLNTKQSEISELIQREGIDHVIKLLEKKNSEFSA